MDTFPFPEPRRIAFSGDWHLNAARVEQVLHHARNEGAEVLVQLGDFGVMSSSRGEAYLEMVNRIAAGLDMPVVFIDGNHENFDHLYSFEVDDRGVRPLGTHLFHAPRGLRWQWAGLRFAAFGGATSLDRLGRVPSISWWPQESHTIAELDTLVDGGVCDILLTHDCPAGVAIPGIGHRQPSASWPLSELERAWNHRDQLALAVGEISPTHIFHGHFHVHHRTTVNAFGSPVLVTGLGDDSSDRDEQTIVLDLDVLVAESQNLRSL